MKVLGVDPGLVQTGWGLVNSFGSGEVSHEGSGIIKTSPEDAISERMSVIYRELDEIIKRHRPEVMVIEKLYSHYKHPTTSILMGHARGVVCLAAGMNGLRLVNYPATHIKKCVTGNGRARKEQVQRMITMFLDLADEPVTFDASDALAAALTFIRSEVN